MVLAMQKAAFLLFSLTLIAADQLSKWAVTEHIIRPHVENAGAPLSLLHWYIYTPDQLPFTRLQETSFFNWVMVWNKGISFGLLNQATDYGPFALIMLSLVITLVFLWLLIKKPPSVHSWGFAMIIGGAIGNVIDRLRFGAVIDFLDFHANAIHWPAFNVADSCVCAGVFLLITWSLFFERPQQFEVKT